MNSSEQIFESINTGLVVLSAEFTVLGWNRWMEHHSGITAQQIIGTSVFDIYPNLAEPKYRRQLKSVLTFGNFAYFSQKLHRHLFAMKNPHSSVGQLPLMQQSCTAGPLRNEAGAVESIFITVQDVTENVASELLLRQKVAELEEALKAVKLLEGIITICMYCKKICEDEDSWKQMEQYISEHSEAQFSHGICPDCFSKKPWE